MSNNQVIIKSKDQLSIVKINHGELVSYMFAGEELIHQKGSLGWENSDTEMFPVIGPVNANQYIIQTKKGVGIQDQHGFLKELTYDIIDENNDMAIYQKKYIANTRIKNSLFPIKSTEKDLYWPYNFMLSKSFTLTNSTLQIQFELEADRGMPFMLGYHPAFKLSGNNKEYFIVDGKKISLQDVIDKGGPSYPFMDVHKISLFKENGLNIEISESGFGNMMLWTEVNNMVCMEPISQYPDLELQKYSESNLRLLKGKEQFKVVIKPF